MMEHDDWNWKITYKSLIDEKNCYPCRSTSAVLPVCVPAVWMLTERCARNLPETRKIWTDSGAS